MIPPNALLSVTRHPHQESNRPYCLVGFIHFLGFLGTRLGTDFKKFAYLWSLQSGTVQIAKGANRSSMSLLDWHDLTTY